MAPAEQLAAIERRAHELVAAQYRILNEAVFPGLAAGGVERVRFDELSDAERRHVRSEEHTSELQSHLNLVCRLLLEKKKKINKHQHNAHKIQVGRWGDGRLADEAWTDYIAR